jgi:hypothetical protein
MKASILAPFIAFCSFLPLAALAQPSQESRFVEVAKGENGDRI